MLHRTNSVCMYIFLYSQSTLDMLGMEKAMTETRKYETVPYLHAAAGSSKSRKPAHNYAHWNSISLCCAIPDDQGRGGFELK